MRTAAALVTLSAGLLFAPDMAKAQAENSSDQRTKINDLEINLTR